MKDTSNDFFRHFERKKQQRNGTRMGKEKDWTRKRPTSEAAKVLEIHNAGEISVDYIQGEYPEYPWPGNCIFPGIGQLFVGR